MFATVGVLANCEIRLRSDATSLKGEVPCILAHVLSDELIWGLGFTQAIEARWPQHSPTIQWRLRQCQPRPVLGEVLWTEVDSGIELAHLVVERSRGNPSSSLDLGALRTSLAMVAERAHAIKATVHAPPLGTGLTVACWSAVHAAIESELVERGIPVVIHCLGSKPPR